MIQDKGDKFVAKVKENQKGLSQFVQEIESVSAISSHHSDIVKQSKQVIRREVFVYNDCTYSYKGLFIRSIIRIDKTVDNQKTTTHYYVSNARDDAKGFLKKILEQWRVETMHFYKDTALNEDRCKINKGAFALSVLRSFVINILHLNKVDNIARKITETTYDLAEALTLVCMTRLKYGIVK